MMSLIKLYYGSVLLTMVLLCLLIPVNAAPPASSSSQLRTYTSCPLAFTEVRNSCVCNAHLERHKVICDIDLQSDEQNAYLVYGNCISLDIPGHVESDVIVALCPFTAGKHAVTPGKLIPKWPKKLQEYCEHFNRSGRLCEKCSNSSYGIDALSVTFDCIPCTDSIANWFKYFTVKLLPLTLFVILVIFFHIGVTSASVNGFVLYSQVITLPVYVLVIESGMRISLGTNSSADTARSYTQILTAPLSIWSLGFDFLGHTFAHNSQICLGPKVKIIHLLALEYVSAIYPLLLLLVVYGLIELHSRNCRPLVYIWKACRVCIRFRRQWSLKTSLVDSFATFFLLSYTKFVFVSFSLLAPSQVFSLVDHGFHNISRYVLLYDPSVEMYSAEHCPYAALAYIILVIGILISLLLFFFPFKFFQNILNCFSCCSYLVQTIHTFADTFQGCYKNGRNGGPDRRYFVGIYLFSRTIITSLCILNVHDYYETFSRLTLIYVALMLLIHILQPYKHHFHNCLDVIFFTVLGSHSLFTASYFSDITKLHSWSPYTRNIFYLVFALLFVPLAFFICFICYWLIIHLKCTKRAALYLRARLFPTMELVPILESQQLIKEPDRLENPERYEEVTGASRSIQDWESFTNGPTY